MDVEQVPISSVTLDPENVRKHPERNIEAIKQSLTAFGQQKPIVVGPDGVCVAGNGTLRAAALLGWETISIVRSELQGGRAKAYAIADNRTTDLSSWSPDLIKQVEQLDAELSEIFSKETLFTKAELASLNNELGGDHPYTKQSHDTSPVLLEPEYKVIISCNDENHQRKLIEQFAKEGLQVEALMI